MEKGVTLKRKDFDILVIWLGGRAWDASDLRCFNLSSLSGFQLVDCPRPFVEESYPNCPESALEYIRALWTSRGIIEKSIAQKRPIAVFTVTTAVEIQFAMKHGGNQPISFPAHAEFLESPLFFDYKIVMGGYLPEFFDHSQEESKYTPHRVISQFGLIWIPYNGDAPTAGGSRLAELIARIMGCDLPGDEFPDYSREDLQTIGRHISHESFNAFGSPSWAIPKYPIGENGRPVFPDALPYDD